MELCDPYDPNWFSRAHLVEIHALGHAGRNPGSQVGKSIIANVYEVNPTRWMGCLSTQASEGCHKGCQSSGTCLTRTCWQMHSQATDEDCLEKKSSVSGEASSVCILAFLCHRNLLKKHLIEWKGSTEQQHISASSATVFGEGPSD